MDIRGPLYLIHIMWKMGLILQQLPLPEKSGTHSCCLVSRWRGGGRVFSNQRDLSHREQFYLYLCLACISFTHTDTQTMGTCKTQTHVRGQRGGKSLPLYNALCHCRMCTNYTRAPTSYHQEKFACCVHMTLAKASDQLL